MTPVKKGSSISRRDFVRNSALVGAGFFIVPRHVLGRGFIAPSDKLNIVGIGIGGKGYPNLTLFVTLVSSLKKRRQNEEALPNDANIRVPIEV